MYGFRADFVWIPYRCMYEFRADFVWKSYSNLVWKVVAKSHTFPINFPHLQLVHFPYESRTPLFTGNWRCSIQPEIFTHQNCVRAGIRTHYNDRVLFTLNAFVSSLGTIVPLACGLGTIAPRASTRA